jgi:hypothetical protein
MNSTPMNQLVRYRLLMWLCSRPGRKVVNSKKGRCIRSSQRLFRLITGTCDNAVGSISNCGTEVPVFGYSDTETKR